MRKQAPLTFCIVMLCLVSLYPSLVSQAMAQEVGSDDGERMPLFRAQFGLDGNLSTGNFKQRRWNSRGVLFARYRDHISLSNSYRYSYMKSGDIKFSDDFRDLTIINFKPFERFTPYLIGLYHQSFTRFIDRRWMIGVGGSLNLLRSKEHQLKIGVSGSYEWTRLDGRPPPFTSPEGYGGGCLYRQSPEEVRSCDREMWRVIPRLVGHHQVAEGRLIIDYEALWVVDPQDLDDERVFVGVTLAVPINAWLRVYTHYDFSLESIVLKHRERIDTHLNFGVNIKYAATN